MPRARVGGTSLRRASESPIFLCGAASGPAKSSQETDSHGMVRRGRVMDGNSKKFACPFSKLSPEEPGLSRACKGNGFATIARVKEHISRTHLRMCCPICNESFESREVRDKHIRELKRSCNNTSTVKKSHLYINENTMESLRGRNKKSKDLLPEQQWYTMWDVLFPGHGKPESPYVEQTTESRSTDLREIFSAMRLHLVSSLEAKLRPDVLDSHVDLAILVEDCLNKTLEQCRGLDLPTNTNFDMTPSSFEGSMEPSPRSQSASLIEADAIVSTCPLQSIFPPIATNNGPRPDMVLGETSGSSFGIYNQCLDENIPSMPRAVSGFTGQMDTTEPFSKVFVPVGANPSMEHVESLFFGNRSFALDKVEEEDFPLSGQHDEFFAALNAPGRDEWGTNTDLGFEETSGRECLSNRRVF